MQDYLTSKRANQIEAKNNLLGRATAALSKFGPLTTSELKEKADLFDSDIRELIQTVRVPHSSCVLDYLPINRGKITPYFGKLAHETVFYMCSQDIELGFKLGDGLLTSLTYPQTSNPRVRYMLTRQLVEMPISNRTQVILRLHFAGVMDYIDRKKEPPNGSTEAYWAMICADGINFGKKASKTGFRKNTKTPLGEIVFNGVKKNLAFGWNRFFRYWKVEKAKWREEWAHEKAHGKQLENIIVPAQNGVPC